MINLKKLTRSDAGHKTHNNEDARVITSDVHQNKDVERGRSLKARTVKTVKVARKIPYYYWIWEKAGEVWDLVSGLIS